MFAFTQTEKCGKIMAVMEFSRHSFHRKVGMQADYGGYFMERWENRYTHSRNGAARAVEHSKADRIKNILLILLAVALLGIGIAGGQAIVFRGETKDLIAARAIAECGEAVSQADLLSRSGGSDTAGALGKIRANINAVDVLSSMNQSLYGQVLAPQSVFTDLYNVIDSYSAKLKVGSATIEELTNLKDRLSVLQAQLVELR